MSWEGEEGQVLTCLYPILPQGGLGGVDGHHELAGREGTRADLFGPSFATGCSSLAFTMSCEGERVWASPIWSSISPQAAL